MVGLHLRTWARDVPDHLSFVVELNATPEYARNKLTPQYYLAELARPEEMQVTVSQRDFELALRELVPSVSEAGTSLLCYSLIACVVRTPAKLSLRSPHS